MRRAQTRRSFIAAYNVWSPSGGRPYVPVLSRRGLGDSFVAAGMACGAESLAWNRWMVRSHVAWWPGVDVLQIRWASAWLSIGTCFWRCLAREAERVLQL